MQELIDRITAKTGISGEQATQTVETIKDYVKEKFPMLSGAVDNMFGAQASNASTTEAPKAEEHGFMDKIKEMIPADAGEKVEDFAKNAAQKAGAAFENVKEKIEGMMGGDKK